MGIFVFTFLLSFFFQICGCIDCIPKPGTPTLSPLGKGRGIFPGRVVWNYDKDLCKWDGTNSSYWWDPENLDQSSVNSIIDNTIIQLSGENDISVAWNKLFEQHNFEHTGVKVGYKSGESIAIKVNMNIEHSYVDPNNGNSVSPQSIFGLVQSLVTSGGVDQKDIYVYDACRWIQEFYYNALKTEFPNINYRDNKGERDYVEKVEVDESVYFQFSNSEVTGWNETRLPFVTTNAKYLITLGIARGHDVAGITLTPKNFFGNINNPKSLCDFGIYNAGNWCPKFLHKYVYVGNNAMGTYNPLVDLLGHDQLGGNGLLYLIDGFYSGIAEHEKCQPIHYEMPPFNDSFMCSFFGSLDPVALDSVLFDFLRNEPNQPYTKDGCIDNYLHEAAEADNPPSQTIYNPTGKKVLSSLGVHEHWNNEKDKKYSRNLGENEGIELIASLK